MADSKLINQWIRERRSVYPRSFPVDRQWIDRETLRDLIENATWAPTHRMTEPWHFTVFEKEAVGEWVTKLKECYRDHVGEDNVSARKLEKMDKKATSVGAVIAISMKRDPEKRVPEWEEISAVSMAIQNIYLSLAAYNLGGYLGTPGFLNAPKMKEFLGLGAEDMCLGFMQLGYLDPDMPITPRKRVPLDEKTDWR